MKTKPIPALVMLFAGVVACLVAIFRGMDSYDFLKMLLFVLVGFYVAGCVIKVILDKNFQEKEQEDATGEEETQGQEEEQDEVQESKEQEDA